MAKEDLANKLDAETKAAEKKAVDKTKELPAMAAPTVSLPIELRKTIATYCRDNDVSFAKESVKMWMTKLTNEKVVTAEAMAKIDLSVKRGGGISKEVLAEKDSEIDKLKAELEALKAKKTQ